MTLCLTLCIGLRIMLYMSLYILTGTEKQHCVISLFRSASRNLHYRCDHTLGAHCKEDQSTNLKNGFGALNIPLEIEMCYDNYKQQSFMTET